MFTGLVEDIGEVIEHSSNKLTFCASFGAALGDSISVNGTCLTVIDIQPFDAKQDGGQNKSDCKYSISVGISEETYNRTNLESLTVQSKVNLERALLPTTRMGGHFLQGHIDMTAKIALITPQGTSTVIRFVLDAKLHDFYKYIVFKGFIAVDGTSLTVSNINFEQDPEKCWFEITLIEYSASKVVLALKSVGEKVNIEVDILGKYVERQLEMRSLK